MKYSVNDKCPCGSGLKYKKCCQKFHKGAIAKNALELMKSRYAAYAMCDVNYIIKTTHKNNVDYTREMLEWKKDIEEFCYLTEFISLDILSFIDGDDEAYVTFKANLKAAGEDASFIEESKFFKEEGSWFYHSAKIS